LNFIDASQCYSRVARLIELIFFAFIFYSIVRRLVAPLRKGFAERERERNQERMFRHQKTEAPKIDRSGMKDAEFKDI